MLEFFSQCLSIANVRNDESAFLFLKKILVALIMYYERTYITLFDCKEYLKFQCLNYKNEILCVQDKNYHGIVGNYNKAFWV